MKLWDRLTATKGRAATVYLLLGALLWVVGSVLWQDQHNLNVLVVDYQLRHQPTAAPAAPSGS